MRHVSIIAAIVIAACTSSAGAEEKYNILCQTVGTTIFVPVGHREDYRVSKMQISCRVQTGPMAGGGVAGTEFIEWDGNNGVLIAGDGVERRSDGLLIYEQTSGKMSLAVADDKITDASFTYKGRVKAAFGVAASLAGRTYTATSKSLGPGQYEVEEIFDPSEHKPGD